ncbi:DUF7115 domain-containing protein [Halomarina oriensis]|uniref:DUF7115 domain-containing protein n=1 Tax=Halomarina oriensis TaxID=671145 RepID=A0A6B0GR83_9EURY|nr:hypothetical protein [Halomarina oriensis]MWG34188.1 hypothetical protein [Halomarina oriensis]
MDTPSLLSTELGDDAVDAKVPLGGDDLLVVTPARTLVYRSEGLLRDETVETVTHDVDRVEVTEGRRKTTIATTAMAGDQEFTVPTKRLDDVLTPFLSGVLRTTGETSDEEAVLAVYRFSELTLVVTEGRVVKHVGTALWDTDAESFPFEAVTDFSVEEGSVATQLVLTVDGRPQRIKAPSERAGAVRQTLQRALFDYHGVDSLVALRTKTTADDEEADGDTGGTDDTDDTAATDEEEAPTRTVEPLLGDVTDGGASEERTEHAAANGTTTTIDERTATIHSDEVLDRLDALEATVDHQTDLIERQQETIETLIEELRQGR